MAYLEALCGPHLDRLSARPGLCWEPAEVRATVADLLAAGLLRGMEVSLAADTFPGDAAWTAELLAGLDGAAPAVQARVIGSRLVGHCSWAEPTVTEPGRALLARSPLGEALIAWVGGDGRLTRLAQATAAALTLSGVAERWQVLVGMVGAHQRFEDLETLAGAAARLDGAALEGRSLELAAVLAASWGGTLADLVDTAANLAP
jgi:hypothetical protein